MRSLGKLSRLRCEHLAADRDGQRQPHLLEVVEQLRRHQQNPQALPNAVQAAHVKGEEPQRRVAVDEVERHPLGHQVRLVLVEGAVVFKLRQLPGQQLVQGVQMITALMTLGPCEASAQTIVSLLGTQLAATAAQ
jgi:hypothetical protein